MLVGSKGSVLSRSNSRPTQGSEQFLNRKSSGYKVAIVNNRSTRSAVAVYSAEGVNVAINSRQEHLPWFVNSAKGANADVNNRSIQHADLLNKERNRRPYSSRQILDGVAYLSSTEKKQTNI